MVPKTLCGINAMLFITRGIIRWYQYVNKIQIKHPLKDILKYGKVIGCGSRSQRTGFIRSKLPTASRKCTPSIDKRANCSFLRNYPQRNAGSQVQFMARTWSARVFVVFFFLNGLRSGVHNFRLKIFYETDVISKVLC